MNKANYNTYHFFFRNLSNSLKSKIIAELRQGDKSVSQIIKNTGMEQSKVSHALASLRTCSLVNSKIFGKQRIYSLNKKTLLPILKIIDKHKKEFCKNCKFERK